MVLGGSGFLGSILVPYLEKQGCEVFLQTRALGSPFSCDPSSESALANLLRETRPDIVLNLVAQTDVDLCERKPGEAFHANVGTLLAFQKCLEVWRGPLVQISTDQVYSGLGPHAENKPAPINVYGITKFAAERVALALGAVVIRTNFVGAYPKGKKTTFSDWLVNSFRNSESIHVFEDIYFSPLHVSVLCCAILAVIRAPQAGIFNVGSIDGLSKAQFAFQLGDLLGFSTKNLQRGVATQKNLPAKRPQDMRMRCEKFVQTYGFSLPNAQDTLRRVAADYL